MLPAEYELEFQESLCKRTYGARTLKTYRSMFRRMCRDFDEEDLRNEATLTQYRAQMSRGSVGIFDALWGVLRQTAIGASLPSTPRKPIVMYPHPLFADVMLLGAALGNERLSYLTWADVDGHFMFGESEKQAATRCLTWASGLDHTKPSPETPLVPKDHRFTPMQLWQIEYIINSPTANRSLRKKCAKEEIAALIEEIVAQSVAVNAPGSCLRTVCDRAKAIGSHAGSVDFKTLIQTVKAAKSADALLFASTHFPCDTHDDTPAMW